MIKIKKGKFFVFEGPDGSGKSTQTKLLAEFFKEKGFKVEKIDFPQHGEKSSGLVDEYLIGKYGEAKDVGPYVASVFYACDRYDASFKIRKWLEEGRIVISDRYLISNVGHQGGKIKNIKNWRKYVSWLYDLEYGIFKIPKPDYTFILKTSADFSLKLVNKITDKEKIAKKQRYLSSGKKDVHEKDRNHQSDALNSFLLAAKEFPRDFKVIECLDKGELLAPEIINGKIIKIVEKTL